MTPNFPQMVAETISELPVTRQAEVYHFAKFMKTETKIKNAGKVLRKASVFALFGTAISKVTDGAANHDKYLYE